MGCRERLRPLLTEIHFNVSALFFRKFAIPRSAGGKFAHLQPRINNRWLFITALQWGFLDWENERHKLQDCKPRQYKWHRARAYLLANFKQQKSLISGATRIFAISLKLGPNPTCEGQVCLTIKDLGSPAQLCNVACSFQAPGKKRDVYQQHGTHLTALLQEAVLCRRCWFSEAIKMTDGECLGGAWLLIPQAQELRALQAGSRFFSRRRHHRSNPDTVTPQPPEAGHGCAAAPGVPLWAQRDFCSGQGSRQAWGASRNLRLQLARLIPPGTAPKIAWPKIGLWESLPEIEPQKTQLLTMSQCDKGSLWTPCPQAPSV